MKRKYFIFISILAIVTLFTTAALCNQCSITPSTTTEKIDVEEETAAEKETSADRTEDKKTDEETTEAEEPGEKEKPEISLAIVYGPEYKVDEELCFYRVKAMVTGNPKPTISFSKDDSDSAWGKDVAQVNLYDPDETYTLTATATNSEGSDTATINISWGCPEPEPEPTPEPEPEEAVADINVDTAISGYIVVDVDAVVGGLYTYVGDHTNDKQIKAYLSFNINSISSLDDVTVKEVSVSMPVDGIGGHPELMPNVHVRVFDYGNTLELADQGAGGDFVAIFPTSNPMASFNFSTSDMVAKLQSAVDAEKDRFQLKLSLEGINVDGITDWYRFKMSNIVLHVEYEIPG